MKIITLSSVLTSIRTPLTTTNPTGPPSVAEQTQRLIRLRDWVSPGGSPRGSPPGDLTFLVWRLVREGRVTQHRGGLNLGICYLPGLVSKIKISNPRGGPPGGPPGGHPVSESEQSLSLLSDEASKSAVRSGGSTLRMWICPRSHRGGDSAPPSSLGFDQQEHLKTN